MANLMLSVCLITYNHEKYIRQAIESVLVQNVGFEWELIVADDFSTDGTRAILQEYHAKHPDLIRLILQDKNVGPYQNWLDLMTAPESNYIAYFEGDDYWIDSNKLQKQVDFLEKNKDCAFCFHKAFRISDSKPQLEFSYPKNWQEEILDASDFFRIPTIPSASVVLRNTVAIPRLDHSHGDLLLYGVLLSKGKAGFINEEMSVYRLHGQGVSSRYNENWYLERRIGELLLESKLPLFSKPVQREIEKLLVEHIFHYLNKNRGKIALRKKAHYFGMLAGSRAYYEKPLREHLTLLKTLLS